MAIQTAERVSFKDASDNVILQRHLVAYEEAKKHIDGKVIEVGCGEGYGIELLAPLSKEYLALDKFPTHLDDLLEQYSHLTFQQKTVPPFPGIEDNYFDQLVSFQVIEHIEDDELFVKEAHRVLKTGGRAIITTPNIKMSLSRNPWHIREYTLAQLESLLAKYFSKVEMIGLYGNEKINAYYEKNKASVQRITRFDIFNLQYRLPRQLLQIPYDILNRWNRRKLQNGNQNLVSDIQISDYFYQPADDNCLDFFCIAEK